MLYQLKYESVGEFHWNVSFCIVYNERPAKSKTSTVKLQVDTTFIQIEFCLVRDIMNILSAIHSMFRINNQPNRK